MRKFLSIAAAAALFALPGFANADTDTVTPTFVGGAGSCFRYEGMSVLTKLPVEYAIRMPVPGQVLDSNTLIKLEGWITVISTHPFATVTATLTGSAVSCNGSNVLEVLAPTSP
jgi:hypothetical protein